MFPFTRVPFWVPFFHPQPPGPCRGRHRRTFARMSPGHNGSLAGSPGFVWRESANSTWPSCFFQRPKQALPLLFGSTACLSIAFFCWCSAGSQSCKGCRANCQEAPRYSLEGGQKQFATSCKLCSSDKEPLGTRQRAGFENQKHLFPQRRRCHKGTGSSSWSAGWLRTKQQKSRQQWWDGRPAFFCDGQG